MPATEPTPMEDPHASEDEKGNLTHTPSSLPLTTVLSSTPPAPTTTGPNFTNKAEIESKAVSMASNDCSSALSSPAEASPAKPAVSSPTTFDGTIETSPATSHMASASDSLLCKGTSLVNIESSPSSPVLPCHIFGSPDPNADFPTVLTFKGVSVSLENNNVWKQFYSCGTEMILTKQGRRMFPYCRYRLAGLDPERKYSLVLSIVPLDHSRYRWSTSKWEVHGPAENQTQGLIRALSHHYSPRRGSEWMAGLVSFYKIKLTNNPQDLEGHIILHSMHRYIPRLHVIPVPDGDVPSPEKPVITGPESMTFTFPQTQFMAVTTYQNFRITQLKINHNPFAKGFRGDGKYPSVIKAATVMAQPLVKMEAAAAQPLVKMDTAADQPLVKMDTAADQPLVKMETAAAQPLVKMDTAADQPLVKMETAAVQPLVKMETAAAQPLVKMDTAAAQPLVKMDTAAAQPLVKMDTTAAQPLVKMDTATDQPLVKMETQRPELKSAESIEIKEEVVTLSIKSPSPPLSIVQGTRLVLKPIMSTSSNRRDQYVPCIRGKHALGDLVLVEKRPQLEAKEESSEVSVTPQAEEGFRSTPEVSPTSRTSPGFRKRRKRINRHWANARGRQWNAVTASPTVVHSPSLTVAMQPELDDVEGLLFVSFASKEALEVHIRDKPANNPSLASPVSLTTPMQLKQTVKVIPETDVEKIADLEAILLQDLQSLKHRQVIHPVLQEVGLKLSCLDQNKTIDLQYLGVRLPLPPPNLPEQGNAASPGDEGLPFISRTGKTSDITKIKGWKNKFIRSNETSPSNSDGSQKNLSAFCSNMLDEYLESEAQNISERAAAFSTNPEGSVAYQLPAKSSSYVKTLDSVLKHRNAAPKLPAGANRPCPLSHKPLLYSALTSPAPPLASTATFLQATSQSVQQSASSCTQQGASHAASGFNGSSYVPQKLSAHHPQPQRAHRPQGFTKFQFSLLKMEIGAQNEGLSRTELTPDRLNVALSTILTKDMLPSQVLKVPQYPKNKSELPECGQDFCRMGCVCLSLQCSNRGPLHCRRPECMFGCACFKRKIIKQLNSGETEERIQPLYSMTNMEHVAQPRPGSHADKLWTRNSPEEDPDPLYSPASVPVHVVPIRAQKRSLCRPMQPIREEDKDPVYKYLESMMTCARVREFNSKPPPVLTLEPDISTPKPKSSATPQETTTNGQPKKYYRTLLNAEKASYGAASVEADARKQIEIQSACQWSKDRKRVLETLCRRMSQNRLSHRFSIGPYRIRPVAKISMRKPSGSLITYRVHISKPSSVSDNDEDELDDSDEERHAYKSFDMDMAPEDEDWQFEEPGMPVGVTPFLRGVLPAGKLKARTKPVGCQAYGLIQVNGKSYNQARLLLGNMGSLHPANRLAAHVTGRLNAPTNISYKKAAESDPANKVNTPGPLYIKAAGTVVPPIITARKTTELKTPAQPPVQPPLPDSCRKGSFNFLQPSQNSSTISSVQMFVSTQRSSVGSFQNSITSSPVSLTVSPSLKTPSFLGQSGTYSFRICPPANQATSHQNLPGVALPGGFTLIQLPKPGVDGAAQQSEYTNTTNTAAVAKALLPKDSLFHHLAGSNENFLGLDILASAKELLSKETVEPEPSPELAHHQRMSSEEREEVSIQQVDSTLDTTSEDLTSDDSDYSGEGDEDDEVVDIETLEEVRHGVTFAKMNEDASDQSRKSSDGFGSARDPSMKDLEFESRYSKRRTHHLVTERRRRDTQRTLFDKLQGTLQPDVKTPRLQLLSMALKEIRSLSETSKFLEEKKRRLTEIQALYVKEISTLSGKSELLVRRKLTQIYDMQKLREKTMKWSPFYSHLLQSRAALLQDTTPNSNSQRTPILQPSFFMAPSQVSPHTTAAHNQKSVESTLKPTPHSQPTAVSSPVIAPPPQTKSKPVNPGAPAQVRSSNSQTECQPKVPPDAASTTSPSPKSTNTSAHPPQPFALPLIRSKTGRIILPSSMRPTCQGFYTLMLMNSKLKEDGGEVNVQPSDVESSKSGEKSLSESNQPDSESSRTLEEDKTVQSSDSCSGVKPPLTELALLNKSIYVPSVALKALEKSQDGGARLGVNNGAARLSFNCMKPVHTSVEPEPDVSPTVGRRGRGRPRKSSDSPVSENGKHTEVEETTKSVVKTEKVIPVIQEGRRELSRLRRVKNSPGVVKESPVLVKRGRGRPPRSALLRSPPGGAGNGPSNPNKDSLFRLPRGVKSPNTKPEESSTSPGDRNKSRPMTRGALGKDFPSAKKRSWIDVEKELEPDLESE
ncbi:MAX gene-associated protein isoform 2-T3 [Acanthopagrus schlegelii]